MAQVTTKIIGEGPSHLTLRVDLLSDASGELENYVILSPWDLTPVEPDPVPSFCILQAWFGMTQFDITLKSGTVVPSVLWTLTRNSSNHIDFRHFGGLVDKVAYTNPLADTDGKLTISTSGFNVLNAAGSLVLEIRKLTQVAN